MQVKCVCVEILDADEWDIHCISLKFETLTNILLYIYKRKKFKTPDADKYFISFCWRLRCLQIHVCPKIKYIFLKYWIPGADQ